MKKLIEYLKAPGNSQVELAKHLGLSQSAIARWLERGQIPAIHVLSVSSITGIEPFELRPDIYPETNAA